MSTSLRGVNLAGAEWKYKTGETPVKNEQFIWVSETDIDYLRGKGVAFGRLIFSWELLQPTLGDPLDPVYRSAMHDCVKYATDKGMHVMIEPHGGSHESFARYKGNPIGSAEVPNSAFADLWTQLANLYKGDSKVSFGLMNEPNNISTAAWFGAAQAAVTAIRNAGAGNLIMVPGNGFSQPAGWMDSYYDTATPKVSNATGWATLKDPLHNMVVSVHTYFDTGGGGTDVNDIAGPNIIAQRLQPVVDWARPLGLKVHLSEFGTEPGELAKTAVANAITYMNANADVIIGWAWWTYGPPLFWSGKPLSLAPTNGYATDDPKLAWLTPHFDAPSRVCISDNPYDTGAEPNNTTSIGWESPDIWVRQAADNKDVGESVKGGRDCYVYVNVRNRGLWPSTGSASVRLFWAKATTGMTYPGPWDGSQGKMGGPVHLPLPIPPTGKGEERVLVFPWTAPNPTEFGGDGHFCLLAVIGTADSAPFALFSGADLNANVRRLSTVALRNIHIIPSAHLVVSKVKLGLAVMTNGTGRDMLAQLAFEVLDSSSRPVRAAGGTLLVIPQGAARERFRENRDTRRQFVEEAGDGAFRILDPEHGIPSLTLRPGEHLPFALEYDRGGNEKGFAVRAIQYFIEDGVRHVVGGQTFVVGEVEGLTTPERPRSRGVSWLWLLLSALLLLAASLLGGRGKRE